MQLIDKEAVENILSDMDNEAPSTRHKILETISKKISSLPIYNEQKAKEVIENLLSQFAYESEKGLHTGGLSALENAFNFLGWSDPQPLPFPPSN